MMGRLLGENAMGYFSGLLVIEFLSGSVYEYYNVPQDVYAELMSAKRWDGSHGKAFYALVKKGNRFAYRLLRKA